MDRLISILLGLFWIVLASVRGNVLESAGAASHAPLSSTVVEPYIRRLLSSEAEEVLKVEQGADGMMPVFLILRLDIHPATIAEEVNCNPPTATATQLLHH